VLNEYLKLHIYQMRSSSLILGQPNTKYCVMKLCGGMAQIPLHAKFTAVIKSNGKMAQHAKPFNQKSIMYQQPSKKNHIKSSKRGFAR